MDGSSEREASRQTARSMGRTGEKAGRKRGQRTHPPHLHSLSISVALSRTPRDTSRVVCTQAAAETAAAFRGELSWRASTCLLVNTLPGVRGGEGVRGGVIPEGGVRMRESERVSGQVGERERERERNSKFRSLHR